jgi:3',5'-cyclic AMP phosphodiesterase CpdA
MMKLFFSAVVSVIVLILEATVSYSAVIEGRVYLDANRNGRWDDNETGLPGVLVSDGRRVVATDASGRYRLDSDEARALLWIVVPRDHRPTASFWRWADGRQAEDFGLVRQPQSDDFCFIQITDTHIGNAEALRQFARQTAKLPVPIAFVVNTGDLVRDSMGTDLKEARRLFDRYMGAAAAFEQPLFNVPGNHDHAAIGVKAVDRNDPLWGKGLYRHLLGPMHYSWDWGNAHFVALDGTSFPPYEEQLGAEQLAWLKADLSFQPRDKPLVLFCHQPMVATKSFSEGLKDTEELAGVLQGRKVLGIFCGHLHLTFTSARLGGFPVYQTGAFCGDGGCDPDKWVWAGPNDDGTPQGFRLVQIKNDRMKTTYSNREGRYPLYVASPAAPLKSRTAQSGKIEIEVVVVDFGKPVEVTARYADRPVPLKSASREELWSTWRGTVDTSPAYDGDRVVHVSSRLGDDVSTCDIRYLVLNGRAQPYRADAPAKLTFEVRGVRAEAEVFLNDKPLGTVAADTPAKTVLSFHVPGDRLAKVNRVTVRAGGPFSLAAVKLEYKKRSYYDLRYYGVAGHDFNKATSASSGPEHALYFCLP